MSTLKLQLTEDMKNAMRAHDSLRLNAIRFVLSELKNFEIDNGEQDDAGVMKVIAKEVKKIKDALPDFERAGREDLVAEEKEKIAIMEAYLPKQLDDAALQAIVNEVVAAAEAKDFGSLMKAVIQRTNGQADGGRVAPLVKAALANG